MTAVPKIKLLSEDKNNNLFLNPQVIKTLQANKKNCGKISFKIEGSARKYGQAKIKFLKRVVGGSTFEIEHTSDKNFIKGVYVSSEPIEMKNKDGTSEITIQIDTMDLNDEEALYQALQNYELEMKEFTSNNKTPMDWLSFSAFEESVFWDCLVFGSYNQR